MAFGDSLKLGVSDAIQAVKDAAGIISAQKNTIGGTRLPWRVSGVDSKFFHFIERIDPTRWNQLFPYRLLVVDVSEGNQIVNGNRNVTVSAEKGDQFSAIVKFEVLSEQWVFTLPITPQQLSITDQFAIATSATLRGVLEEHSGVKFKLINAQGTMGVWPYRESVTKPPGTPGLIQSLFGGTIEAAGNLIGNVRSAINIATNNHPANQPSKFDPTTSLNGATSTGYFQAIVLQQFLEQYAEAKKDPKNAGWRLVFDIPKQNQSFIVTPMQFIWQQSANKPMEITYTMQFKAWRRIDLKQSITPRVPKIQTLTPGILQRILATINQARVSTSAAVDLIGAVRSDVTTPLDVLRQTSLFIKDLAGVALTAADLPFQLQKDYASAIKDSVNTLKSSISSSSSDPSVRASLNAIVASAVNNEGVSMTAVSSGQLGVTKAQADSIDPANNVFKAPEKNFSLFDQVPLFSLVLNSAQQDQVDSVIAAAREITVDDLKQFRAVIQSLAIQLSNNFGTGDAYYNQVYGLPAPTERLQPVTLDEYELLKNMYDTMQSYDILTATTQVDTLQTETNMAYVAGLADLSGIEFNNATSKILAPVPFGLSIEEIAARYLADPQRWIEIATLNNLRDPYIDENGFKRTLLSNATGRQITISSIENLYIGQRVILASSTQPQTARTILGIDRLSDTSFLLTLDGAPDLDNYLVVDLAYLRAYLPGTVNSQQKIFIPSTIEIPNDPDIIVPTSTSGDPLTGLSKVDILLTDRGDVAVNSFGDFRFAAGLTNIIQALRIKFGTQKGKILLHPEFGLGVSAGISTADVDVQEIFNSINELVQEDPRFSGVSSLQIAIDGPTLAVNMAVSLAGQNGVYPLSFQLRN